MVLLNQIRRYIALNLTKQSKKSAMAKSIDRSTGCWLLQVGLHVNRLQTTPAEQSGGRGCGCSQLWIKIVHQIGNACFIDGNRLHEFVVVVVVTT